jgi:ribosomal protein S18 acetylase RimI-like enzyme
VIGNSTIQNGDGFFHFMGKMEKSVWKEYRRLFLESPTFLQERSVEELMKDYEEGISEMVVCGSSAVRGFCIFFKDGPSSYYIEYLGVPPRYQGMGIGRDVLEYVIQCVFRRDPGIEKIWLLCLDDKVAFYSKAGFECEDKVVVQDQLWNKMVNKNGQPDIHHTP